jgi:hypothetical protein
MFGHLGPSPKIWSFQVDLENEFGFREKLQTLVISVQRRDLVISVNKLGHLGKKVWSSRIKEKCASN